MIRDELPSWATPITANPPTRQLVNPSKPRNRCRSCGLELHPVVIAAGDETHPTCDRSA